MSLFELHQFSDRCVARFPAMASPCEVLFDTQDIVLAAKLGQLAYMETSRIERRLSRYRKDNLVHRINNSGGKPIAVDAETAAMLDFADQLFHLTDGLFDITSGVLRRAWKFDGSDNIPTAQQIDIVTKDIGWPKVTWESVSEINQSLGHHNKRYFTLPEGMEIDFGGIGKEYAVDCVFDLIRQYWDGSFLVNFGGDLRADGIRQNGQGWIVAIESVESQDSIDRSLVDNQNQNSAPKCHEVFELSKGAIATSGDSKRFLLKEGVRYSHILNPTTGWPVVGAARSITTYADTCLQAGIFCTMSMLLGQAGEQFLEDNDVKYWSIR